MNLILYPKLGTKSKRALTRKNSRWGKPYKYRPRGTLIEKLARENKMTATEVRSQLQEERRYLLLN